MRRHIARWLLAALTALTAAGTHAHPAATSPHTARLVQQADSLARRGNAAAALPLYAAAISHADSLHRSHTDADIAHLDEMLRLQQLKLQRAEQAIRFHTACIIASTLALAIIVGFVARIYANQRKLRQAEAEGRRLTRTTQEANEQKSRFLGEVSYYIRSTLNNVVGFSQLLATPQQLDADEKLDYSHIVERNAAELIDWVNDLLDLSRLEAGRMKYRLTTFRADEWAAEVASLLQMRSQGSIELLADVRCADATLLNDRAKLTQRLMHTLLYSDPAAARGTARSVRLTLAYSPADGLLHGTVLNAPIADPALQSLKVQMRHDICRLYFSHFGGSFSHTPATGEVRFTLPATPAAAPANPPSEAF